jgi:phosphohistidine swiveling domain-containing protein
MWKVYLVGSAGKTQEVTWQEKLRKEFEGRYLFLRFGENVEGATTEPVSLDSFFPPLSKAATVASLSALSVTDIVVSNASVLSFEAYFQLYYANLIKKPIILFAEGTISEKDLPFINLLTDNFLDSYEKLTLQLRNMQVLPVVQDSQLRNVSLQSLQKEIANLFSKEDRKDPLFRGAILATQIGQLLHYLTHDKQVNPGARTVGSRADEEAQLGDCLVQLAIYSLSRSFNLADIYSIGVRRMEENVWRGKQMEIAPRELRPKEIGYGISASAGTTTGRVVVVRTPEEANKISEGKCIVAVPEYTKPVWDEIAARIDNVLGLISGTGSPNMHPAIVCRELKKPCIVSAKDLVNEIRDNEIVTMTVGKGMDENSVTRTT